MSRLVKLNLLDDFVCLGADCPATCCTSWELAVSDQDLARWQTLDDSMARNRMLGSVQERIKNGTRLYELRKYANGHCVHFNDDGLCQIQVDYGHAVLPEVCQSYPRFQQQHADMTLQSARLACPGVVALLAKAESGNEFHIEHKTDGETAQASDKHGVDIATIADELLTHFERVLAITDAPLGVRIYMVANVLGQIARQAMEGKLDQRSLAKLCGRTDDAVARRVKDAVREVNNGKIMVNKDRLGRLWQQVFQHCGVYAGAGLLDKIQNLSITKELQQLNLDETQPKNYFVRLYNQVEKLRREAHKKYSPQVWPLMAAYFRVSCMNNSYPWQPVRDNFNATFLNCIFPFAKVQMLLWILATQQDKVSVDDAVNVIAAVERIMTSTDSTFDLLAAQPEYLQLDNYANCLLGIV